MDKIDQVFFNRLLHDSSFLNWVMGKNNNDIHYWDSYLEHHPEHFETIESAKEVLLGIKFNKQFPSEQKVTDEFDKVIKKSSINNRSTFQRNRKLVYLSTMVVFLFIAGWFSLNLVDYQNKITHRTNYGEIIDLKLPDGTSVVLNGNSEISYERDNPRYLHLKGEAYFKVKPILATSAKFWVVTNDLTVEVLGTQFHMNTRLEKTKVILDEGSIHLELKNGERTEMSPGEVVSFSKQSKILEHEKVSNQTPYTLWNKGTYIFNKVSLGEVMTNLENTYGIEVKFNNPKLMDMLISGGIPNQDLIICIAALERATNTRIQMKDNFLLVQENAIIN
ncbi:MAG: FecR domain-containing protein [Maribacter sp.]